MGVLEAEDLYLQRIEIAEGILGDDYVARLPVVRSLADMGGASTSWTSLKRRFR